MKKVISLIALGVFLTIGSLYAIGLSTDVGIEEVLNRIYRPTTFDSGELAGSATAVQMPNVPCNLVRFKAESSNAGGVYIGVSGVTVADGTTDTSTGFALEPGDDTGWIPTSNLNNFYRICDNAGDDLTYIYVVS